MQRTFVIHGKNFIFRDPNPDEEVDFQYLDNFYRELKKCAKIEDDKEQNNFGAILARKVVIELIIEPKLSMSDIENGGIIEDLLAGKVLAWITEKIESFVEDQKKN